MPNGFSKVMAFLFFVLLIIFTVYQNYKIQDDLAYQNAFHSVTDFVDNVRSKGYITPKMYEDFQQQLDLGNYHFNVDMIHKQKIYTPIYTDPKNVNSFTGEYVIDYDEYYNEQIEEVLFNETSKTPIKERMYKLQEEDFFQVVVKNKSKTNANIIFDFLTANVGNSNDSTIYVPYGGMVLNEDY
ncbi:hypothetical protein [Viridibacillus arvi]|uniref:hypothetical protein n=1 Tax=Viridibacillus arvi TaxID=263475 RepID=UPI003D2C1A30